MDNINDLTSNQYWNQSTQRKIQKFYIAFCLLNSAIFDYSVGLDLKEQSKLNWSASCFYYSMVHCARLLIFIPFGNFPSGHQEMIKFLTINTIPSSEKKKFNWLYNFTKDYEFILKFNEYEFSQDILINYYNNNYRDLNFKENINNISQILINSKNLREGSNYEALLIAHENFHGVVERLFENLSSTLSIKSEDILKFSLIVFKKYVIVGDFSFDTDKLKSYINLYIQEKLLKRIVSRIRNESSKNQIKDLLNSFLYPNTADLDISSKAELESHFSMEQFSLKSRLFQEYFRRIDNLRNS